MCTVIIIPKGKNDFVLTSSHDVASNRISLSLNSYTFANTKTMFSKARLSVRTWIGVSDKNRLICLRNGGFVNTSSIRQVKKTNGIIEMDYFNLQDNSTSHKMFNVSHLLNE